LLGRGCHGNDEIAVYKALSEIVEEIIAMHEKDGIPLPEASAGREYSGEFVVRVSPEIHRAITIRAMLERRSLNSYVVEILKAAAEADPAEDIVGQPTPPKL
jgi:predicted HicB family RNase H-like nuclease